VDPCRWTPIGENFRYVFKPRPSGRGPDWGRTAHAPRLPAWGPLAGTYLWAAGYPPAGTRTSDEVGGHPRWPEIVLACSNGVNPAARSDPASGNVNEDQAGDELVG